MSIHPITLLNNPRLREKTVPVTQFDASLRTLIEDMFETMYAAKGIGLAATQIVSALGPNDPIPSIAVIDVTPDRSKQWCLINPEMIEPEGETLLEEGCLSIPGVHGDKIPRFLRVTLKAQNQNGQHYEIIKAEGLLAHCIQHELDHLKGEGKVLFIDYFSDIKKQRAIDQFEKTYRKKRPNSHTITNSPKKTKQ